eukprot:gnl/TRDRNA2_/TRDRNA2_192120_c0_seq1.p1 gnl/TRDRNA2_/TRDRNA2_192120_c0~~gnl/TRDRNA2_/TRDRNA2_192120_c0_seq1.p1  ORF type:complete len:206 (+),score=50.80 gnl/TRDRNA2_/TRDRNA2_192120_c0_seq1:76-693(+)
MGASGSGGVEPPEFFGGQPPAENVSDDAAVGDSKNLAKRAMTAQRTGNFDLETLGEFDGVVLAPYIGVCGKVYDVQSSNNFSSGESYATLWVGRDATYALAKLSLKPEDANRLDWSMQELCEKELQALGCWAKHFASKYPEKGTLKEYEGWCFDAAFEAAQNCGNALPGAEEAADGAAGGDREDSSPQPAGESVDGASKMSALDV